MVVVLVLLFCPPIVLLLFMKNRFLPSPVQQGGSCWFQTTGHQQMLNRE